MYNDAHGFKHIEFYMCKYVYDKILGEWQVLRIIMYKASSLVSSQNYLKYDLGWYLNGKNF